MFPIPSLCKLLMRLWISSNRFDFLNLVNIWVVIFTSKVTTKLSGFFTTGKGGRISLRLLDRHGMVLDCTLFETAIPCLEFSIEFQSNNLIYHKEYTKWQQIIYVLIKHHLRWRGFCGYRKISQWLNKSGIKTHRGKKWFNSSVISVLKRKHQRDLRIEQIRNQHFPTKISKFEVNYYIYWLCRKTITPYDQSDNQNCDNNLCIF